MAHKITSQLKRSPSAVIVAIIIVLFSVAFIYTSYQFINNYSTESVIYVILSLIGAGFWLFTLYIPRHIRNNIVTIFVSAVIGLYIVEFFLNAFSNIYVAIDPIAYHSENVEYDARTSIQVYEDLSDQRAVIKIPPLYAHNEKLISTEVYPLAGISKRLTVYCNESGKFTIYTSDRYGFNNPDVQWEREPIDIVLLGDSFVHGACVDPGDDIASQIRALTDWATINLGYGGSGPLTELAILKEYAAHVQPRVVLWSYYEQNDLNDIRKELQHPNLSKYTTSSHYQNLRAMQRKIDKIQESRILNSYSLKKKKSNEDKMRMTSYYTLFLFYTRNIRFYNIRVLLKNIINLMYNKYNFTQKEMNQFYYVLKTANDLVRGWGGELYFVYLPSFNRYKSMWRDHKTFQRREDVINLVKSLNIPVVDIHELVFSNQQDPLDLFPFKIKNHYSADGYRLVAESIVDVVGQTH